MTGGAMFFRGLLCGGALAIVLWALLIVAAVAVVGSL